MKKIQICFFSYIPMLRVFFTWTTDLIPSVGDEITIESKFVYRLDKKYFSQCMDDYPMTFRVKKRLWNLDKYKRPWDDRDFDVRLVLDWTEDELIKVEEYLNKLKK